ncbi:CapA family protein (plasmid) [Staphylococcus epidermidis]|nr:CapA family protein [Staphylococcus epidermidis]
MTIIFAEIDTHFNHEKVSFVAVGDNLIHPVVYNDAKTHHNDYDFSSMYKNVKPYIKRFDIAYINQESPMGGMIYLIQVLKGLILLAICRNIWLNQDLI